MMDWKLDGNRWLLVEGGRVLDTLTHDRETNQYRDSRGTLLGRRWDEARDECEARRGRVERKAAKR